MKKAISELKIRFAHYIFHRPLPFPLTYRQSKKVKEAQKNFNALIDEKYNLIARKKFVAYSFNQRASKRALVVHGWMSKSLYMIKIIEELIKQGFHVVSLDLPGHGNSPRQQVSWKDSVSAILEAQDYFEGFDLALGHSYGGSMLLNSTGIYKEVDEIKSFLNVKNMVMIASPVKIDTAINLFSSKIGLTFSEKEKLTRIIEKSSTTKVSKLDGVYLQSRYPTKTNIHCIHDINDNIVPFEDSEYLQTLGDRVTIDKIRGIGHLKVIYDPIAINYLSKFLNSI